MTNSLQDLIDASIFISTEYQARLAELVGTSEWNVDFTSQSLDFETTPPLSLKPHLWAPNPRTAVLGFGLGSSWATSPTLLFLPLFRRVKPVSVTAWLS